MYASRTAYRWQERRMPIPPPSWKLRHPQGWYSVWIITYAWLLACLLWAQQPKWEDAFKLHVLVNKSSSSTSRPLKQPYDSPTVLVVNGAMLTPDYKGGDARILTVIRALQSLGYGVVYVHVSLDDGAASHLDALVSTGVEVWGPMTENFQVLKTRLATHRHVAVFEWMWPAPEYLGFLQNFNKILSFYSPEAAIVPVADDVMYKRLEKEGMGHLAKSYQVMETFFWARADVMASINSEIEEEHRRTGTLQTAQLRFCPSPEPRIVQAKPFHDRNGIAFMGFNNDANRVAVCWILSELHAALWQHDKTILLHIIGTVDAPPGACTKEKGCIHHGQLDDDAVADIIAGVRWFVAPVFTNAGISTKILFSLTCGTPVLTTQEGLSGMPVIDLDRSPTPFFIVNTAGNGDYLEEFLTYYLTEETWQSKQTLTHRYIHDQFGCDQVKEDVRCILAKTKDKQSNSPNVADLVGLPHLPLRVVWDFHADKRSSHSIISDLIASLQKEHADSVRTIGTDGCSSRTHHVQPDVFIRFLWPPDFSRPSCCPPSSCAFVVYQPWEMGFIPETWKPFLEHVDAVWVPSLYTARMFTAQGALPSEKLSVVPHGIHPRHKATRPEARTDFRNAHGVSNSTFLFLYVGALLPRKGWDILLDAWCQAFRPDDQVALVFKTSLSHDGDGQLLELKRRQECGRIIHIQTWNDDDDLASLYKQADIVVHPSRAEDFGLTPLEALSFGKIIIAPNVGSTNDFLSRHYAKLVEAPLEKCTTFPCQDKALCMFEDKTNGNWNKCETLEDIPRWHPPLQPKLVEALTEVYHNRAHHQPYVPYGKHVVETHFSWSAISKVAVYEMFKVWHLKNHNGTRSHTLPSQWETNQAFDTVMNSFIMDHGARNFSAAEYL